MTGTAEEYQRYARQCVEIASTFQDEEARATLLDLARAWLRLAHLALANRHIAELTVQIARQRAIVKHALDTGRRSEMAESLRSMRSKRASAHSRSTGYFCSVAADHPAPRATGDAATGRSFGHQHPFKPGGDGGRRSPELQRRQQRPTRKKPQQRGRG